MREKRFEWDDKKAASNAAKHGVTFDDARSAFDDFGAVEYPAEIDIDSREMRFRMVARSTVGILAVVYVEREARIRIISARKATRDEKAKYRDNQP